MLVAGADSHTTSAGTLGALGYGIGATDLAALWALGEMWLGVPKSRKIIIDGAPQRFVGGKDIILRILGMVGQEGAMHDAVEFEGSAFQHLEIADRITIANMVAEIGAATCVLVQDDVTTAWLEGRTDVHGDTVIADEDAEYVDVHHFDVSELGPQVAAPDSPDNVFPIEEIKSVKVDQVFVGSCANGFIEDLRKFTRVLGQNKFHSSVRVLVTPATQDTYRAAIEEGIVLKILEAGGAVQAPSCGPCLGGYGGVLAEGEVCLSTSNRNYKGRMGHPDSKVYLSSPEVAAATAITGVITHPASVVEN
jgi:3-isopropylmalate/(R)-2-methylmalate dehydratase large subunit